MNNIPETDEKVSKIKCFKPNQQTLLIYGMGNYLVSRSEIYTSVVNLQLFSTVNPGFMSRMYIYENILLFVPCAVLLYLLADLFRRLHCSLLLGTVLSLGIEIVQYLTKWGRCELDDVLMNTLGMLVGFMVCRLFDTMWKVICNIRKKSS